MGSQTPPQNYGPDPDPDPDPESVLHVAEHFLRHRSFNDSKMYSLQVQHSDPNLPGLSQIIAISDVLLASETRGDHYSILNLTPFCADSILINQSFKNLTFLLNPSSNPYPFANEAFELVHNAFTVLSDPLKKTQFDDILKNGNVEMGKKKLDGFWTVCPYCYYVFEYAKVYEGCNLRCQNEKCRQGFRGLVINSPPVDVLIKGEYSSPWTPFIPVRNDYDDFVDISDDSENLGGSGGDMIGENSKGMNDAREVNKESDLKKVLKRTKKSVGRNTTKVMGTGNRVRRQEGVPQIV